MKICWEYVIREACFNNECLRTNLHLSLNANPYSLVVMLVCCFYENSLHIENMQGVYLNNEKEKITAFQIHYNGCDCYETIMTRLARMGYEIKFTNTIGDKSIIHLKRDLTDIERAENTPKIENELNIRLSARAISDKHMLLLNDHNRRIMLIRDDLCDEASGESLRVFVGENICNRTLFGYADAKELKKYNVSKYDIGNIKITKQNLHSNFVELTINRRQDSSEARWL